MLRPVAFAGAVSLAAVGAGCGGAEGTGPGELDVAMAGSQVAVGPGGEVPCPVGGQQASNQNLPPKPPEPGSMILTTTIMPPDVPVPMGGAPMPVTVMPDPDPPDVAGDAG